MNKEYDLLLKEAKEINEKSNKEKCLYKLFGLTYFAEIYTVIMSIVFLLLNNVISFKESKVVIIFVVILFGVAVLCMLFKQISDKYVEKDKKLNIMFFCYITISALFYISNHDILSIGKFILKIVIAFLIHFIFILMCKKIKKEIMYIISSFIFGIVLMIVNKMLLQNIFDILYLLWYMFIIAFFTKGDSYKIINSKDSLKTFNALKYIYMFNVHLAFMILIYN